MQRRTLDLNERIFVIKNYYARTSYKHVEERWEVNFRTPVPSKSTMFNLVSKFEVTGSVSNAPKEGRPKTVRSPENMDKVAAEFVHSPKKSIRQASKELNISRSSLHRILHGIGLKPYRPHLLHALNEDDPDKRLKFCENFVHFCEESPDYPDRILWTDEACFKLNGHVNRHNCVYWEDENPRRVIEREVNVSGVTVWAGITSTALVGPFFFEGTVNGPRYLDMLETEVFPIISEFPHFSDLHFQQDGAPAHYAKDVRQWLDETFSGR